MFRSLRPERLGLLFGGGGGVGMCTEILHAVDKMHPWSRLAF